MGHTLLFVCDLNGYWWTAWTPDCTNSTVLISPKPSLLKLVWLKMNLILRKDMDAARLPMTDSNIFNNSQVLGLQI